MVCIAANRVGSETQWGGYLKRATSRMSTMLRGDMVDICWVCLVGNIENRRNSIGWVHVPMSLSGWYPPMGLKWPDPVCFRPLRSQHSINYNYNIALDMRQYMDTYYIANSLNVSGRCSLGRTFGRRIRPGDGRPWLSTPAPPPGTGPHRWCCACSEFCVLRHNDDQHKRHACHVQIVGTSLMRRWAAPRHRCSALTDHRPPTAPCHIVVVSITSTIHDHG
jgi:hypothetical protein